MKNFILTALIGIVLCFSVGAHAQASLKSTTYGNTKDTVTNTASKLWYAQAKGFSNVSVQFNITKISGTVAGNAIPVGSIDGVNFYNISTDTLKATDVAAQGKIWNFPNSAYIYYGVRYTGTGTMSASATGNYAARN